MKSTQLTELFANIKKTIVSFFSIMMFVAMGIAVFCGILWSGPSLENAADNLFQKGHLHNYQILFAYGLTEDDMAQLAAVEGIEKVEGVRVAMQDVKLPAGNKTLKCQTISSGIDVPEIVEGELPKTAGQIALKASFAQEQGLSVGDSLTFEHDADEDSEDEGAKDGMKYLNGDTFEITGLVESTEYIGLSQLTYGYSGKGSGTIHGMVWTLPEAFDANAFRDGFPVVNVTASSLAGLNTYSDAYKELSDATKAAIEDLGGVLSVKRFESVRSDAEKEIADGEKKIKDAEQQIKDGEQQIKDGEAQIADGEQRIKDGEAQVADGEVQLANGRALAAKGEKRLKKAQRTYNRKVREAKGLLNMGKRALDKGQKAYDYYNGKLSDEKSKLSRLKSDLKAAKKEAASKDPKKAAKGAQKVEKLTAQIAKSEKKIADLEDGLSKGKKLLEEGKSVYAKAKREYDRKTSSARKKLRSARNKLDNAYAQIAAGEAQLADAKAQIEEGKQTIKEKKKEIKDGKKEIKKGKKELAEKRALLNDAKRQFEAMKSSPWTVSDRSNNPGAANITVFSDITNRLSISMALLFIIVGLLVTYSAVSRIVHEQITQIGTKKALGFRSREITLSFVLYAGLAVVAGAIIGLLVAVFVIEIILSTALDARFIITWHPPYFDIVLAFGVTAIELALVLIATWLACRSILAEQAVELLKGEKPPAVKARFFEKWSLWEKLPLFTQTIVNNCINDRRRVFSTIVGVAGCTALVVTALTLNDDVLKSYDKHYENVYNYNAVAYVDPSVDGSLDAAVAAVKAAGAADCAPVFHQTFELRLPAGGSSSVVVVVPQDDESFSRLYHVNAEDGDAFDTSSDGAWVTRAYGSHLGVPVGDSITLNGQDSTPVVLPIKGYEEFYLTYYEMVLGRAQYESAFNTQFQANAVLIDLGNASIDDVDAALDGQKGFVELVDDKVVKHGDFEAFSSVSSAVVLMYMVLAILMAIVVLLNLFVMFISEKKRELIVLMINGFSVKEAKKYIYNDTIVLTALGILAGLLLGMVMGAITVASVEPDTAFFLKDIDPVAIIVATASSTILATIMTLISLRRIPAFELTDINKF